MKRPMTIRQKLITAFLSVVVLTLTGVLIYFHSVGELLDYNLNRQERYYNAVRITVESKTNGETVGAFIQDPSEEKEADYRASREAMLSIKRLLDRNDDVYESAYLRSIGNLMTCYFDEVDDTIRQIRSGQKTYYVPYYRSTKILSYLNDYLTYYTEYQLERDSVEYESMVSRVSRSQAVLWGSLFVGVIVMIVFVSRISRTITTPIEQLVRATREMAKGHLDLEPIAIPKMDEVGILTEAFNRMQRNTAGYIQELKQASIIAEKLHEEEMKNAKVTELLQEAQLSALRAQINPHFLFNTLNVIARAAVYDDPIKAEALIVNLSALLRYSLDHIGAKACLKEELDITDRYIRIQQYRFGDRVRYYKKIEPGLEMARIPSMILQPLIENAVSHGTEKRENGGSIFVRALSSGEKLILLVYDDGVGISGEKREEILQDSEMPEVGRGRHIGLSNVIKRVRLQNQGRIEIMQGLRQGTLIRIETKLEY